MLVFLVHAFVLDARVLEPLRQVELEFLDVLGASATIRVQVHLLAVVLVCNNLEQNHSNVLLPAATAESVVTLVAVNACCARSAKHMLAFLSCHGFAAKVVALVVLGTVSSNNSNSNNSRNTKH